MKDYQILRPPFGLILHSRFFIQDRDRPETRIEFNIFEVSDDIVELPNGWNAVFGSIVTAQCHVEDNYNEVSWTIRNETFWSWFNRVMIKDRDKYEIFLKP